MFKLYKTWILSILRKPINTCWAILFPCILITLFSATMGNLDKEMQLSERIKIVMVDGQENQITEQIENIFQSEEVSKNIELLVFNSEEEARKEVMNQKADAYFTVKLDNERYNLAIVSANDTFKTSMIKEIFQNYSDIVNINYSLLKNAKQIKAVENKDFIHMETSYTLDNIPSFMSKYTYPAIVFSILQIGILITGIIHSLSPGLSYEGARIDISPQRKGKLLLSSILALFTVGMISIIIVTLYANFILKIQIGFIENLWYFLILYAVGLFTCIALGAMITMICANRKNMIDYVCTLVVMVLYFVAGGMVDSIPITIRTYVPLLHYINPASTISYAISKLSYHQDMKFFWFNIICTFGMRNSIYFHSNMEIKEG